MSQYSEGFKKGAVAAAWQGVTQSRIFRDLGVSQSTLSQWVTDETWMEQGLHLAAFSTPVGDDLAEPDRGLLDRRLDAGRACHHST